MKERTPKSPWLPYGAACDGNVRLLLLPHAGAGASVYRQWAAGLPDAIGACPVLPPGRERRRAERPFRTAAALVSELAPEILASINSPYAIFGHSTGALCAFELAREIRSLGGPAPVHLFVAGRRAPQLPITHTRLSGIPVAELALTLKSLGGTPDVVLADHGLLRMLQPILAADFSVNEDYAYRDEGPLQIPITTFAATHDAGTGIDQAEAWKEQAGTEFRMHVIEGGHFAIFDQRERIHDLISDSLRLFL
jgi:medium-chain acyl-[acyl-carrier-protein] hydrolase